MNYYMVISTAQQAARYTTKWGREDKNASSIYRQSIDWQCWHEHALRMQLIIVVKNQFAGQEFTFLTLRYENKMKYVSCKLSPLIHSTEKDVKMGTNERALSQRLFIEIK